MAETPRTQLVLAAAVVGLTVGALLLFAWLASDESPGEPEPVAEPQPDNPVPEPSGRTVYRFEPPPREPDPEPTEEPEVPTVVARTSVPREVMADFTRASNEATGALYHDCLRPWRGDRELPDTPLTINLVLLDGRVGDVELISPTPIPTDVRACMKDAMWSVEFPEYPPHRGELKIQRTLSLNR